ncbi:C4-dicarboxylate ABC transporter substrate-binding protein [Hypericibacter adhaerens]|uniref:C4-dicarboxylate ABC transporter substrate-binding protein n=1 Tax=Hypericibacter adhaerens TaxID=2602016 RepID=A0A5J6MTD5_9PROT|nr:TAXI family TRAP transporter solute-binding subunit [Hypericibacter adhaerens]QEX20501.1 C4-dicarboxylate ABC transporter substrate-binding protein [Hypericibacter adhaerens]
MREFLRVYGLILLLVAIGFYIAAQYMAPLPPRTLKLATGVPGGVYAAIGDLYRQSLAEEGVTLELVPTEGTVANLALLSDPASQVDAALVQGGVGDPAALPHLRDLGSLFFEPVWVFVREGSRSRRLTDLAGQRIAVGQAGSGTQVVARQLLSASGVGPEDADLVAIGGGEAAAQLQSGDLDAAFFVSARISPLLAKLAADRDLVLLDFTRAAAFRYALPFLSVVTLPAGTIDLPRDLPRTDVTMVAPAAQLVVREDLHPALVHLLLEAMAKVHGPRQDFAPEGRFPSASLVDFPLDDDAARFLEKGPSFFYRYLPFWVAVWADRLLILLVPVLTLAIPLFRLGPPLYRWQVQRKLYKRYRRLRLIEAAAHQEGSDREALRTDLDRLQGELSRMKIPLAYAEHLYHLRQHIAWVRSQVT